MAYPYFNNYQPSYPAYQPPIMNAFQNGNNSAPIQTAPIQGGFIRVQSEEDAKRYPVTAGNSVTFIDDNNPYCYVKSVPLSPMDAPIFKRFRLVEEPETSSQSAKNGDISNDAEKSIDTTEYVQQSEFDALRRQYDDILKDVKKLRFDVDALGEKSTKKMVQKARKDADDE